MDWTDGWYETSTPAMRQALGVSQIKVNCKSLSVRTTPAACISWIVANTVSDIKTYVPYMNPNPATFRANALVFSAVSLGTPIPEVDIDDFFATYESWYRGYGSNALTILSQSIDSLKSVNRNLKFGITVYENELDPSENMYIDNTHLPAYVRAKVDVVRLFLHYRTNGPNYATYVARAKTYFPNADIVGGLYPYDRIDYFACSPNSSARCTQAQEISYFQQALNIQVQLLHEGVITGLDAFPGYFGSEEKLYGSGADNDELPCSNLSRCKQTTVAMRAALQSAHVGFGSQQTAQTVETPQTTHAPTITVPPTNTNLQTGQTQIFVVHVSGPGPFTYQWLKNGSWIDGATSSSYHTPPATLSDNNARFSCRVSNPYGQTVSAAGLMTVTP